MFPELTAYVRQASRSRQRAILDPRARRSDAGDWKEVENFRLLEDIIQRGGRSLPESAEEERHVGSN